MGEAVRRGGPSRDGVAVTWSALKGSERELRLLQQFYGDKTVALHGRAAGVQRLLRAAGARLAHLATHGFFNEKEFRLEQQCARQQATDVLRGQAFGLDQLGKRITAGASNPLSYTGLVLAGANEPAKAGPYGGILTGEAIVDLDLRKLELAVLSACQTGLGDVANGECVHNLQHAFHVAGCPNVVASLWSVPDEATAALMGLFYRELHDGKPPLEALVRRNCICIDIPARSKTWPSSPRSWPRAPSCPNPSRQQSRSRPTASVRRSRTGPHSCCPASANELRVRVGVPALAGPLVRRMAKAAHFWNRHCDRAAEEQMRTVMRQIHGRFAYVRGVCFGNQGKDKP